MKRLLSLLIASFLLMSGTSVFAEGGFTIPAAPVKDAEITEEKDVQEEEKKESDFVIPSSKPVKTEAETKTEAENEIEPETETKTEPETEARPEGISDKEYMDGLTLAFMDGIKEVTPDKPTAKFEAVMVRVPEERLGSAQWYIDGVPHNDYYSSEFSIYNGRITEFEITFPFDRNTESKTITVALEVHLNGMVRRIEKTVALTNYGVDYYDARVLNMVKPVEIEATVRYWTYTYTNKWLGGTNGGLDKGAKVIYMDHYGTSAASIWIPEEGRACWVPYSSISISGKNYTVYEDFTDEDKEIFVNAKGYESSTEYLIWVNLERQRVNLFKGSKGNWDLIRVSTCSSGANTTPTPTGTYTYCGYSNGWFHSTYYVKPVMYLNLERGIALHSILYNPNGTVQDGIQGTPASHGCVRMPGEQISWFAQNVPMHTTVVVF